MSAVSNPVSHTALEARPVLRASERGARGLGRPRPADEAGQYEDGYHIGKNLDELDWYRLTAPQAHTLEPNLDGFGKTE